MAACTVIRGPDRTQLDDVPFVRIVGFIVHIPEAVRYAFAIELQCDTHRFLKSTVVRLHRARSDINHIAHPSMCNTEKRGLVSVAAYLKNKMERFFLSLAGGFCVSHPARLFWGGGFVFFLFVPMHLKNNYLFQ